MLHNGHFSIYNAEFILQSAKLQKLLFISFCRSCLTNIPIPLVARRSSPAPLPAPFAWVTPKKAVEEEVVGGDFVTEATPIGQELTVAPETVVDAGVDAYDFKEYDLKDYDLGEVDRRVYDYGAYDEYGPGLPNPTVNYDDEVGPGVAAETDVSESAVSTAPRPGPPPPPGRGALCMQKPSSLEGG